MKKPKPLTLSMSIELNAAEEHLLLAAMSKEHVRFKISFDKLDEYIKGEAFLRRLGLIEGPDEKVVASALAHKLVNQSDDVVEKVLADRNREAAIARATEPDESFGVAVKKALKQ